MFEVNIDYLVVKFNLVKTCLFFIKKKKSPFPFLLSDLIATFFKLYWLYSFTLYVQACIKFILIYFVRWNECRVINLRVELYSITKNIYNMYKYTYIFGGSLH